jgi:hypothetical protein
MAIQATTRTEVTHQTQQTERPGALSNVFEKALEYVALAYFGLLGDRYIGEKEAQR